MLNKLLNMVYNASEHGRSVDHMLEFCHWFMLLLFIGWGVFLTVAIFRFRSSRNPKANYHGITGHASTHAEFSVVLIEAALLLGFAIPLWGKRVVDVPEQGEVVRVRAIGEQYAWNFHYPGPDGEFGRQKASLISPSNPLGLDPSDEHSRDDVVSKNELFAVNQRPIVVEITSKDVIHAVSIKHMRIAQDAIPGTRVPMWFRPVKSGKYEIVCAQLCGGGHYAMRSHLIVDSQEKIDGMLNELAQMQHPASASK